MIALGVFVSFFFVVTDAVNKVGFLEPPGRVTHLAGLHGVRGNRSNSNDGASCVPPGMRRVSVLNGAFEMVVLGANDIVSNDIAVNGYWEISDPQDIASVAHGTLPKNGTFFDIGANIGYYSLLFARKGYRVFAVEPMTRNRQALEGSLCLNPSLRSLITVLPVALGSPEELSMRCVVRSSNSEINVGNGIMRCGTPSEVSACSPQEGESCEVVHVRTLDSILSYYQVPQVEVVKMDIEAHECEVLKGGQSLFQKHYPAYLKVETMYGSAGCVQNESVRHGYRLYPIEGDTIMAKK